MLLPLHYTTTTTHRAFKVLVYRIIKKENEVFPSFYKYNFKSELNLRL